MPDNTPNTGQNAERVAAFIEDAAKKVQEKQANSNFNQFDFGYKSPSSNFGGKIGNTQSNSPSTLNSPKKQNLNVNNGGSPKTPLANNQPNGTVNPSGTGLFSNNDPYSAIVSNKSTENISVNGNNRTNSRVSTNGKLNGNIVPGNNQVVNGRVQVNRQKGDSTRLTVNDTNEIKSPIAGKFGVQGNQFQPRNGSVGPNGSGGPYPNGNFGGIPGSGTNAQNISGTYNTSRHDMTGIANSAVESVKQQYSDAESVQGGRNMQHRAALYGVGTMSRGMDKVAISNALYGRNADVARLNSLFNPYGGSNFTYKVGSSRSGNIVNDYNSNLRAVENYLANYRINAQNLNRWEIERALSAGKLKHWYHQGDNIAITKGSDIEFALKELLFLRKEGDIVKKYEKASGGIKNTGKAWISEATRDSDVHTGYSIAKASVAVGKGIGKTGTIATKSVIKTGITGVGSIANAPDNIKKMYSKIRISTAGDAAKKAKYAMMNKNLQDRINIRKGKFHDAKIKVNKFNPVGNAKRDIKNKIIAKRENTFIMKRFRALQNRLSNTMVGKVVGGVLGKLKAVIATLKWIVIGAVIIILIIIVLDVILIAATSFVGGGSSFNVEEGVERDASTTMAQTTINYLHDYQYCYTNNIYKCNVSAIDPHPKCPEGGCLMAEKRLPQSWFNQMNAADPWINENKACIDYAGSPAGYNLSKYWGQYVDKSGNPNGIPAANISNKAPKYTASVTLATDEFETVYESDGSSYERRIYITKPITICGNAGLEGKAGTYEGSIYDPGADNLKYNYYKTKNGIKNDNIDGEMEALNNWEAKDNTDIKVTYYYRGSQYSCHLTDTKYSYFFNTNGTKIKYNIDELYKSFLTMAAGVTDNSDSDVEDHEFYKLYSKELFDQVMEDAKIVMTYKIVPDATQELTWVFNDTHPDGIKGQNCKSYGYKCEVTLKIFIKNCGVPDMMEEDAKIHFGEEGNIWMHENVNRALDPLENKFLELNESSDAYVKWLTTPHDQNTANTDANWKLPIWGQGKDEEWDNIKTYYHSGYSSHSSIQHKYTEAMAYTVEFDNLTIEDWHSSIDGIQFPSEIDIADFVDEETWEAIQSMTGIINEDISDWDEVDWSKYTTGDVNLDNFLQFAVRQGLIQNETGKGGLCCFTTYCMIGMYMHPEKAQWIKANLANLADKYCADDGYTNTPGLMAELGFSRGDYIQYSPSSIKQAVSDQLAEGKPMILHFTKSIYEPDGTKVYGFKNGTGTHFMAVYACTDTTVSVCDPATGGQRTMSWDAFYKAQESGGLRTVSAN